MTTYFAQINSENIITDVRVVSKQFIEANPDLYPGEWVETFLTEENNPRKNFAQIGGLYDRNKDAFINKKPFASWVLNTDTCEWEAPVSKPTLKYKTKIDISAEEWYYKDLAEDGIYYPDWEWNELTLQWEPHGGHY